jgi:hypothetical protein
VVLWATSASVATLTGSRSGEVAGAQTGRAHPPSVASAPFDSHDHEHVNHACIPWRVPAVRSTRPWRRLSQGSAAGWASFCCTRCRFDLVRGDCEPEPRALLEHRDRHHHSQAQARVRQQPRNLSLQETNHLLAVCVVTPLGVTTAPRTGLPQRVCAVGTSGPDVSYLVSSRRIDPSRVAYVSGATLCALCVCTGRVPALLCACVSCVSRLCARRVRAVCAVGSATARATAVHVDKAC